MSSSQLSASSSHDELSVGPDRARLNRDDAGGAWCPRATGRVESDSRHHLQVDLLRPVVLTGVQTQGRLGQVCVLLHLDKLKWTKKKRSSSIIN